MTGPIIVQGPGAIGRLLATRLHRAGIAVELLARSRAVNSPGQNELGRSPITLHEREHVTYTADLPRRSSDEDPTARGSLLIVTTKAYDVADALERGLAFVTEDAPVLVLSNGLGHDEVLETLPGERPRLLGTIACGARCDGDHGVVALGEGPLEIGPSLCGDPSIAAEVAGILRRAGFDARSTTDGRQAQWLKAALNCGLNPVAALLGTPNGEVPASRYFPWAVEAARETALVGRASGLDLPEDGWRERLRELCAATARNRCSMLQDLEAGRRLEIDHLNGWVARRARRLQVPTPRNRRLAKALAQEGTQRLARFRHSLSTAGDERTERFGEPEPVL